MTFASVVKALYSYKAEAEDELSFEEDDLLCVCGVDERDSEWMSACLLKDQTRTGLIPNNYVATVNFHDRVIISLR